MVQFVTHYQHSNGQYRLRVTTLARNLTEASNPEIGLGFDQEASAVLMARIGVFKADIEEGPDVLRWLDRMLIKLVREIAVTFLFLIRMCSAKSLPSTARTIPHPSSSPPTFPSTPSLCSTCGDHSSSRSLTTAPMKRPISGNPLPIYTRLLLSSNIFFFFFFWIRNIINSADVTNSLIMIQPTLTSYTLDAPAQPVLLDSLSVQPNSILLLDTYFHILIWHGETIAAWRKAGYQDQSGYENFKAMLQQPVEDAQVLLADRNPVPRYIDCDAGGSQARFLLYKLNPSTTHMTASPYGGGQQPQGQTILTDDVSLQVFMEHLKKLAVTGSS